MAAQTISGVHASGRHPGSALAVLRAGLALLMAAGCVALVVFAPEVRNLEAWSAAPITNLVTRGDTNHIDRTAIVLFGLGTSGARGLRITPECSAVALVLPVLAIAAFLVAYGRRFSAGRVLLAALGTCTVILVINMVRIAVIAAATQRWGDEGYQASHLFVGSAVSLVGFSVGLIVGFKILVSGDAVTHRIPDPNV